MEIEIKLPYAESFLSIRLPSASVGAVLTARDVGGVADESLEIMQALRQPVDSAALRDCVPENAKVVIITTDNTRACPDDKLVPVIISELAAKIPAGNIKILVALGLHAPLNKEELIKKLGRELVENFRVINHDPQQTVFLGTTSLGTPVEVNKAVVEADFRIGTGFIEPHFFAGFSGGRKCILPGVSSARAIRHNHGYGMMCHPQARAGVLEGNPVHEDMLEAARMAGLSFILNVLMNKEKQITHVVAGNPWSAHRRACQIEKEIVQAKVGYQSDITLVTNGGAPLDLDFYQTVKGIDTAAKITRPGGVIVAVSSCHSGLGPLAFSELHAGSTSPLEVLDKIRMGRQNGVDWQNQILANAQLEHTIYLYSRLKDSEAQSMMVKPVHSVEEGLQKAFDRMGPNAKITVIPEGPLVLPVLEQ